MRWVKADQIRTCALRITFGALLCMGFGNACFAQEPPLAVGLAGQLPSSPTSGCDALLGGGLYGAFGAAGTLPSGNPKTDTITDTGASQPGAAGSDHFGGNVPLYGTDLNGNFPLYSTPDLGSNFPLFTNPTPGMNSPLYGNPGVGGTYNSNSGANGTVSPAVNAGPFRCKSGIPLGEWVLYPSLRAYSLYSDNLFLTPTAATKVLGFGMTPTLTAEWTNGIHTTTIYGTLDTQQYPTDSSINTFDKELTLTQRYSPIPDLSFTAQGDYTHKTIASSLTNSIPTSVTTPPTTPTLLPNGNIELPNGNIVAPNGQVVGQANPALALNGTTLVNPFDQYTATGTVSKILNGGIVSLSGSFADTNYEMAQGSPSPTSFTSFKTETFSENSSFAVGPLFYVYSNGSYSLHNQNSAIDANSSAYRVVGGIGTRQFGLFRASAYAGHQGSNVEGSGNAGGDVFGGSVSYYPTYTWAITAAIDQTNNVSSQTTASPLALTLPTNVPVQIALSSSTRVTTPSVQSTYQISPQWTLLANLSYSQIDTTNSGTTNAWLVDLQLSYEIWRNMTLTGEYQYSNVSSNVPGDSAKRDLIMMSANYRF
jgi:hypothetical protein